MGYTVVINPVVDIMWNRREIQGLLEEIVIVALGVVAIGTLMFFPYIIKILG